MIVNKTILVPTDLKDVKLHQMLTYNSLKEDMDEVTRQLEAVAIFCDLTMSEVKEMPYNVLVDCITKIQKMLESKPTFVQRFEMDGIKYGFVPNLDDLGTGEFIDIETYQKNPHDMWKVLSILYRPVNKKGQNGRYEIEPYDAQLNPKFKDIDANTAFGAMLFFWTIGTDLLSCTQKFLDKVKKGEVLMNIDLPKNGDGSEWSTDLLTEIISTLKKYIESPFRPLSYGLPTKATLRKWNKKQLNNDEQ
jgi:hypothetical protein